MEAQSAANLSVGIPATTDVGVKQRDKQTTGSLNATVVCSFVSVVVTAAGRLRCARRRPDSGVCNSLCIRPNSPRTNNLADIGVSWLDLLENADVRSLLSSSSSSSIYRPFQGVKNQRSLCASGAVYALLKQTVNINNKNILIKLLYGLMSILIIFPGPSSSIGDLKIKQKTKTQQ